MANDNGGYKLNRKNRALDDWALRIWGDVAPGAEKPTFLYLDFRYGLNEEYRDVEIGVNFRKGGKEGKIKVFPSQSIFYNVCDHIIRIAENPEKFQVGHMRVWDNMSQMMAGRRVDTPFSDVKIVVGLDEEGIWIALAKKGHDNIKCRFAAPMSWILRDGQGQPLTNREVSLEMGYTVATQWRNYIEHVFKTQYLGDDKLDDAKAKKKAEAFGNSGQQQRGGGQSWGGQKQQQQSGGGEPKWQASNGGGFDDDIPF